MNVEILSDFLWKCFVTKLERFLLVRLRDESAIFYSKVQDSRFIDKALQWARQYTQHTNMTRDVVEVFSTEFTVQRMVAISNTHQKAFSRGLQHSTVCLSTDTGASPRKTCMRMNLDHVDSGLFVFTWERRSLRVQLLVIGSKTVSMPPTKVCPQCKVIYHPSIDYWSLAVRL